MTGEWEPTAPEPPVFDSIEPQTPAPQPRDSGGRWATTDDLLGHVVEWDIYDIPE